MSDALITNRRVHHGVVDHAIRPFHIEIFLNKIGTLPVDCIHQLFSFSFALAASQESADFVFSRGVKEYPQGIGPVFEKLLRTSAHDHAIPAFGGMLDDSLSGLEYRLAVH